MKTRWQWLQEGRIPNDNARWEVGEELNKTFVHALTEVITVIAMRDIPMNLKMMKRCKKLFLIFIRTEIAGDDYKRINITVMN